MSERPRRAKRWPRSAMPGEESAVVPVGEALDAVGRELGLGDPIALATLDRCWTDVVGAALSSHVRPRSLRARVLTVTVDGGPWATEVRYLGPALLARAQELVGDAVAEVRVVVE